MNQISLRRLRLALYYGLAVQANPYGGWLVCKPDRSCVVLEPVTLGDAA